MKPFLLKVSLLFFVALGVSAEVEEIDSKDLDGSFVEGISLEMLNPGAEFDEDDEDLQEMKELVITNKVENQVEETILLQMKFIKKLETLESESIREQLKLISSHPRVPVGFDPNELISQDATKTFIDLKGVALPQQHTQGFTSEQLNLVNTPEGVQLQIDTPVLQ